MEFGEWREGGGEQHLQARAVGQGDDNRIGTTEFPEETCRGVDKQANNWYAKRRRLSTSSGVLKSRLDQA